MIEVKAKVTSTPGVGAKIVAAIARALPLERREQILVEEARPVVERLRAMAPHGPHDPHAAEFLDVVVMRPEHSVTGTRNQREAQLAQLPGNSKGNERAMVSIGGVDVAGSADRAYVLQWTEYGRRGKGAKPFIRPTMDVELPAMLQRVGDRIAKELK